MAEPVIIETSDEAFFSDHQDRRYRIRLPAHSHEFDREFKTLGPHEFNRRRIIVARVPLALARHFGVRLMPIPFLAFADEEIVDNDATLRPIFKGIMEQAGAGMGMTGEGGW